MRRVMLIALALVASLGITASTATTASTEAGVTADFHQDWWHVPAFRPGVAVRDDPGGDEGVLLVHQRPPRA